MRIRSCLPALGLSLAAAACAHGEYLELHAETYYSVPWVILGYSGLSTYRVYAEFDAPDEGVLAVFGSPGNPMSASSTNGSFHNSGILNSLTAPMDLWPLIWSNQWDTYVTIGVDDADGDATTLSPGLGDEVNELATDWSTVNAAWFVTPADPQGLAGPDGRVLLGQFTVLGGEGVAGVFNLMEYDGTTHYQQPFAIPGPGVLTLPALAALAARRRRL